MVSSRELEKASEQHSGPRGAVPWKGASGGCIGCIGQCIRIFSLKPSVGLGNGSNPKDEKGKRSNESGPSQRIQHKRHFRRNHILQLARSIAKQW